jgi:hypothetical protein
MVEGKRPRGRPPGSTKARMSANTSTSSSASGAIPTRRKPGPRPRAKKGKCEMHSKRSSSTVGEKAALVGHKVVVLDLGVRYFMVGEHTATVPRCLPLAIARLRRPLRRIPNGSPGKHATVTDRVCVSPTLGEVG